eukprot:4784170-Pleurochrysis_carterae.AAC.5
MIAHHYGGLPKSLAGMDSSASVNKRKQNSSHYSHHPRFFGGVMRISWAMHASCSYLEYFATVSATTRTRSSDQRLTPNTPFKKADVVLLSPEFGHRTVTKERKSSAKLCDWHKDGGALRLPVECGADELDDLGERLVGLWHDWEEGVPRVKDVLVLAQRDRGAERLQAQRVVQNHLRGSTGRGDSGQGVARREEETSNRASRARPIQREEGKAARTGVTLGFRAALWVWAPTVQCANSARHLRAQLARPTPKSRKTSSEGGERRVLLCSVASKPLCAAKANSSGGNGAPPSPRRARALAGVEQRPRPAQALARQQGRCCR